MSDYYHLPQGTLDIVVQRTGNDGRGNVLFVQNNFYYDAFFLKAIGGCGRLVHGTVLTKCAVLNGACGSGTCLAADGVAKYHVCPR